MIPKPEKNEPKKEYFMRSLDKLTRKVGFDKAYEIVNKVWKNKNKLKGGKYISNDKEFLK